jgi:phage terminase large subunit-like protein
MANVGWRLITRLSLQIPQATINKSDRIVTFANGGEIAVRSADNPDSLRGEGLDLAILDECAFMQVSAWS